MKNPKVSVIMAEYNTDPENLKIAIDSILKQTFSDFEFIIVNDGSSTDLRSIVKELGDDERIKIVSNSKNRGLVYSLNNAIKHTQSQYLVRMDTDDIALENRLETLYSFIVAHPEFSVVGSRVVEFSSHSEKGLLGRPGLKTSRDIMRGDVPVHPSVIMKRCDVVASGGYPDFNRAEDLALWCELVLRNKSIYILDEVLLRYRVDDSDYRKRTIAKRGGELKARLHYYPKLKAGPIEYLRIIKSIMAGIAPVFIIRAYRNKRLKQKRSNTNE